MEPAPKNSANPAANLPLVGALCGLFAAALFGASAPVAKLLLPTAGPLLLAGLLYLGAGLSLLIFRLVRARWGSPQTSVPREAALRRKDYAQLVGIVALGGVLGPVLMLIGLSRSEGIFAALLLNLEAPLTILCAVGLFGEHLGRREGLSAAVIIAGACLLAMGGASGTSATSARLLPALALFFACLCWALDNNLTQRLSLRDPVALVCGKTLGAGLCNIALALAMGHSMPARGPLLAALFLGALSYGLSVVLDTYALRILGAAREAAFFATAPFVGALLAIPLLHERPTLLQGAASGLMIVGVVILLRARHAHPHRHEALEHDHAHTHDEHHQHPHPPGLPVPDGKPHAHPHRHAPLLHDHAHVSDLHHRHRHD